MMFGFYHSTSKAPRGARGLSRLCVGDVHGRLDLLDQLLDEIHADIAPAVRRARRCWCSSAT